MAQIQPIHRFRTLALAAIGLALLTMPASTEAAKFKVKGAGWGHGIGMPQWGTQGYAKQGKSYRWILRHYYRGTKLGQAKSKRIRVLVGSGTASVSFSGATKACGKRVNESKTYSAARSGSGVVLRNPAGKTKAACGSALVAKGGGSLVIGRSAYRGKLVVREAGSTLNAINHAPLEGYIKGVVPNESPSSWDLDALRAQAVAARSYALATGVNGPGYDAYDDTRSQVYGGKATEQPSTNKAVRQTAGEVVISRGDVAPTFFFSTSGGRTEAIENVWDSDPQPHLKSEKDPHDDLSPYHRWKVGYTRKELQAKLGSWVKGRLRKVKVLKTGVSPRVVRARVVGTDGSTVVSGSDIQIRLGLRSTWFKFVKKGHRSGGGKSDGGGADGGGSGNEQPPEELPEGDTGGTGGTTRAPGGLAVGEGLNRDAVIGLSHPELIGGALGDP